MAAPNSRNSTGKVPADDIVEVSIAQQPAPLLPNERDESVAKKPEPEQAGEKAVISHKRGQDTGRAPPMNETYQQKVKKPAPARR
jgi:hypothetical protein